MITDLRELHSENALFPILFTELPIETEVSLEQDLKASYSIFVTELGMVTEVIEQYEKASCSMFVTEFGIVIEAKLEQPPKVPFSILVTELGMVKLVRLEQ